MRKIITPSDGTLSSLARPRRMLLATAFALASTLSMTIASPAQAQDRAQVACGTNRICLYQYNNYGGSVATYGVGSSDMLHNGPRFNDMTSSIRNNSPSQWCAYEDRGYQGDVLVINPWQNFSSLGGRGWDNRISSLRKC